MTDLIEKDPIVQEFRDFRAQINLRSRQHMIPYTGTIHYLSEKDRQAPRVIFQAAAAILARDNVRFPDAPKQSRSDIFQSIASVEYEGIHADTHEKVAAALRVSVNAYKAKLAIA